MTHNYSAGGSRRAVVLTAIIGFHFAMFLVIAAGLVPRPVEPFIKVKPITPPRIVEPVPAIVPPQWPGRIDPEAYFVPEPKFPIPSFPDSKDSPTAPTADRDTPNGEPSIQRQPVERALPSLQGRGDRFADVIRACYPAASRRAGEEGRVLIAVTIGTQGQVRSWRLMQSSGFPRLDAATPCVLGKLRFNAGREDGRAVEAEVSLPIVFRLD